MSEITELFFELLFGSGAFFGLACLIAVALVVAVVVKYSSVIWIVVFIFLAWEYFKNISAESLNFWYFIICLVVCLFLGVKTYDDLSD